MKGAFLRRSNSYTVLGQTPGHLKCSNGAMVARKTSTMSKTSRVNDGVSRDLEAVGSSPTWSEFAFLIKFFFTASCINFSN